MVILDYFVRLPALTAYVAYDKAILLIVRVLSFIVWNRLQPFILTGNSFFKVGAYIYTSANLVQVKPLLW